mmetsp:Transcript_7160/g.14078  ORF Transcript_7160/g.14078 Transcript_7160/m.14078 type:complete len:798 (-) Transcript_7160:63-2456(-)
MLPAIWLRDSGAVKSFVAHSKVVSHADRILANVFRLAAKEAAKLKALSDDLDEEKEVSEEPDNAPEAVKNLTKQIATASEALTDERVALNVCESLIEACEGEDAYGVLSPHYAEKKRNNPNTPLVPGAVLSRSNLNSIVNAILCVEGGAIDFTDESIMKSSVEDTKTVTKAGVVIPRRAQEVARILRKCLVNQVESDEIETTPDRIREMLCPELDMSQVQSLCQRIYDRTGSSARMLDYEDIDEPQVYRGRDADLAGDPNNIAGLQKCRHCEELASQTFDRPTDEERFKIFQEKHAYWARIRSRVKDWSLSRWQIWATTRPPWFSPKDISFVPDDMIPAEYLKQIGGREKRQRSVPPGGLGSRFVTDVKNGDVVCNDCGFVSRENLMHEGEAFRKFEGKEDRNHHGGLKNPLLSNSYNMGTSLSGAAFGVIGGYGRGAQGWGGSGSKEQQLQHAHSYTEMNISSFGKKEKATRTGYKDKQKIEAFDKMKHAGDTLNLHPELIQRAKELFAAFRDDREIVQDFLGIVAACLIEAFRARVGKDGQKGALKVTAGDKVAEDEERREKVLSRVAMRKRELHTTIDNKVKALEDKKRKLEREDREDTKGELVKKPMSTWDMDDVRNWLTKAAEAIAEKQFEKGQASVLKGTEEEMQNLMGEKCFELIAKIEEEVEGSGQVKKSSFAVKTNRVDMGSLGIRWQKAGERGSGGAGGLGNSGRNTVTGLKVGERKKKTAGQILMLKTSANMSRLIGEEVQKGVIGRLIHNHMKETMEIQAMRNKKRKGDLNAIRRITQMDKKFKR